jgi:hypothetical protein
VLDARSLEFGARPSTVWPDGRVDDAGRHCELNSAGGRQGRTDLDHYLLGGWGAGAPRPERPLLMEQLRPSLDRCERNSPLKTRMLEIGT